MLDRFNCFIY